MLREMHEKSFVMMESLSYFPEMKFKDINVKDANVLGYFLLLYSLKRHKNSFKKYIDLMLTEGVMKDFYGVPCVEFGMGVDVDNFKEHEYCGKKDEINLLMVGCSSVYHGTDRIINSMIDYYQNEENKCVIKLHLVGSALEKHKELAQNKLVKDKIIFYGQQFGDGLEKIYDMCNVALGPLSQHRLKKRDTGLKTKEYLAKGIPYVYSGEEIQLEDNYPYIMKVPDTEDLLDLNTIIDFYNGIKDDTDMVMNMRKKARDVFSWISIFEKTFYVANKVKGGIEKCY
jgi:glycosyltransferase involved in cell wall biosynthesis